MTITTTSIPQQLAGISARENPTRALWGESSTSGR